MPFPEPLLDIHNRARRSGDEIDKLILHSEGHADRPPSIADELSH